MSKLGLGLATALFLAALSFSGCCAPLGSIGPGCIDATCNSCSGASEQFIANGPIDALRNARRRLVCGSGCGETYVGEWISTPPDCSDPCCGGQFVGGATKCRPFCWQPGTLLRGLYGQRVCSGNASSAACSCGSAGCGGGQIISAPAAASSCGCASNSHAVHSETQIVTTSRPAVDLGTTQRQVVAQKSQGRVETSNQQSVR